MLVNKKEEKFEEWYNEVLEKAQLVSSTNIKGCDIYLPYCYDIWEIIKGFISKNLKSLGFKDVYFPMFIPLSSLKKESEHFRVFSKETLRVTKVGDTELNEELVIRPTSEMAIYENIKKFINKKEDLPLLLNQWCSVVRWEILKENMPLIRSNEFLWQESHSIHSDEEECNLFVENVLEVYRELIEDYCAIPLFKGFKPQNRIFPGALYTLALEAMMPNCKSVQTSTSHSLGTNFSKVLDITFNSNEGKEYVWQACNGITTRLIGCLAMVHGDNNGLVLPPKIAPIQCVFLNDLEDIELIERINKNKLKVEFDTSNKDENDKINYWMLRGIPLIIKSDRNNYILIRRDTEETTYSDAASLISNIKNLLVYIQNNLFERAKTFKNTHTFRTDNFEEFKDILIGRKGFVISYWCGDKECAKKIREEILGSLRVVNPINENKVCIKCNKEAKYEGVFGQSY